MTAAESFLRADVAMSGHCRPKQERTSHALLQGLLLLSVCLAPSQAHPGGARPCPLLDMSPADVTRAPGSSGPHAPENEGLVAHCPVMIPRETPCSADAPCCMSVALLCPHGYPSYCYCLPSCCRTCNRRFVCRRCGLCSGKHLGDALVAANASTAVVGCCCRQNILEPLELLVHLERCCCADSQFLTLRIQESFVAYCTLQAAEEKASFWSNETGFVLSLTPLLPDREL